LLRAAGASGPQADAIAQAIIAWRSPAASPQAQAALLNSYRAAGKLYGPPAAEFTELGELTYVLGMTPDLYAALKPHLSLFQAGAPDRAAADPVVQKALDYAGATDPGIGNYEGAPVLRITACAAGGAALCRDAIVTLGGTNGFQFLQFQDGP
jgi:general secretion pathway protein K